MICSVMGITEPSKQMGLGNKDLSLLPCVLALHTWKGQSFQPFPTGKMSQICLPNHPACLPFRFVLLCATKFLSAQVRKELEVNGIEFYPQKEFDEDLEDKTENDKIRVGNILLWEGNGWLRAGQI